MGLYQEEKNFVLGRVNRIFYQNPANFYQVVLISVQETNLQFFGDEIVITGSMGHLQEEGEYRFYGKLIEHPKYGEQLQVESYVQEVPNSKKGLITYFSSKNFPGIGKKTATQIVDTLGSYALEEILDNPDCLRKVSGLNKAKREMILEVLRQNCGMDKIIVGLNQFDFGSQLAVTIYNIYKSETLEIIQKNPYRLVEDVEGIGFKKADAIADQVGIAYDSSERIRAAILHELFQYSMTTGDTYIEADRLLPMVQKTLESSRKGVIEPEIIAKQIIFLGEEGKIHHDETKLFEKSLFYAEHGIAKSIASLLADNKKIQHSQKKIKKGISNIEKKFHISYGDSQREAIEKAINSPFFILTGGPGTGKTTVINGIVHLFSKLNDCSLDIHDYNGDFPILLAAPTGRAAKRMNETTHLPAVTIHRLLGLSGHESVHSEEVIELKGSLLIVDEFSMVDTWLANLLLKAVPLNMQVIFVGDKDQLPSVSPGQVLHDLLTISGIPQMELTDIYRQEKDSSIISLAHEIKQGSLPIDFTKNQKDRSFFAGSAYDIEILIRQIVTKAKEKGYTAQEIQILAPMYRGIAGIDALNKMIQNVFNPNLDGTKKEVKTPYNVYRIGDKILHLVNDPERNVFNGDFGMITGIIEAKNSADRLDELVIDFDGTQVSYTRNEWSKITLSYACSIHKSQGSEFRLVILPMLRQYNRMLKRNLLYTAITRSKESLILLGEESAFYDCVHSEEVYRRTMLKSRLEEKKFNFSVDEANEEGSSSKDNVKLSEQNYIEGFILKKDSNSYVAKEIFIEGDNPKEERILVEEENSDSLTMRKIASGSIDPMIGMDGITPYHFVRTC
ncbi:MAG: ATP-dependent RecD-like DNA helicase [Lactobacillales bacterium]|jgi:exodeoxyribonuclease V alpha subunit|nr:ATP-dependent RecD-like DNA helicase [Lactobacillales bacterium]